MNINFDNTFKCNPVATPNPVKDVVFLRGSWYEMGVQYGSRCKETVRQMMTSYLADVIKVNGSRAKAVENNLKSRSIIDEQAPELMDFWKGMSEGADIPLEDILTASLWCPPDEMCSTVSAWGNCTAGDEVLAGVNNDGETYSNCYEPVVVAYPEEGNAFISYSGILSNCMVNDKGVALLLSAGPCEQKGDLGAGLPPLCAVFMATFKFDNVKDAVEYYCRDGKVPGGENFHIVDAKGNACIVERTNSKYKIRKPGDFGESEYMIATNCFKTAEMFKSNDAEDPYGSFPRYETENELFVENYGKCNADTINDILGCLDYYVSDNWVKDDWSPDNRKGMWSPENKDPESKCLMRCIAELKNMTVYVMNGSRSRELTVFPGSTGNFFKLKLSADISEIADDSERFAKLQIFRGAKAVSLGMSMESGSSYLEKAKEELFVGTNYKSLAICEENIINRDELFGLAVSAFGRAQCYAQLAQEDTHKILREYDNYKFMG